MPGCAAPRNIYIDAGVNWCNTLTLYQSVPEAQNRLSQPWTVFGFEASRSLATFAERCCNALTAGLPLPEPPLPPAGSSRDLARFAPAYNCSMAHLGLRERSEHDRKLYKRTKLVPCMLHALRANLTTALRSDPRLTEAGLLDQRLALARSCSPAHPRSNFVLLPAAVGKLNGSLKLSDSPVSLLTGGGKGPATQRVTYRTPMVGLSEWMASSFTEADFVVLKMDVEGGEHSIVPQMARDGTLRLVDVFLWECHHMPRWWRSPCHKLLGMLRRNGVGTIYEDPYPWKQSDKDRQTDAAVA